MPVQAIASAAADGPGVGRLTRSHPLAKVAAQRCGEVHEVPQLIDRMACEACWDYVILADRAFARFFELTPEVEVDRSYVDPVAVAQALEGRKVPLTKAERAEVKARRRVLRTFRCAGPAGAR